MPTSVYYYFREICIRYCTVDVCGISAPPAIGYDISYSEPFSPPLSFHRATEACEQESDCVAEGLVCCPDDAICVELAEIIAGLACGEMLIGFAHVEFCFAVFAVPSLPVANGGLRYNVRPNHQIRCEESEVRRPAPC